jgi:single-stranded-DNA-specific exonuclease
MNEQSSKITGIKYLWKLPDVVSQAVVELALAYNISFPIMQTIVNRGIASKDEIDKYLFSILERDVAHPLLLKDAEKAIDRILIAIDNKEKILVCGDYDVDGVTSSAMMMLCLLPLTSHINFFLPHRVHDGYGLSVKTIQRAAKNGYTVVVTVDNGISAFEPALEAKRLGIDLIITDHHRPHEHVPEAYAIINPHQADCLYPYKKFAGVGVIFKLISLLYERLNRQLPPKVYELLLLGTVADVVPLTGENRFWVRYALKLVNSTESLSLRVLKHNARFVKPLLSSTDIGFFITPQINALGRLEDAREGVKFLIAADVKEVERVGGVLKELNEARKTIEKSVFSTVEEAILAKKIDLEQERIILASSHEWQPGVIGLVASRLVGAYNRPALLFHVTKDKIAKGSCRSIQEFNMFEALQEHKEILISFGGHAMAAGLSLPVDRLEELKERLENTIKQRLPVFERKSTLRLDAEITLPEVTKKLVADMAYLEPFGNENAQPTFYLKNVSLVDAPQLLKDAHVKCMVFKDGVIKPVIFFNRPELYQLLMEKRDELLSLAVHVTENHWNGKVSIELQGMDVALSTTMP